MISSTTYEEMEVAAEEMETAREEARLRRLAKRNGLALRKSRTRIGLDNHSDFMIVDVNRNWIVAGSHFDLNLEDVAAFLEERSSDDL